MIIRTHAFEAASEEELIRLQRVEARLVDALLERPGIASRRQEHRLRYGLSLAMLDTFQPGAAARGSRTQRDEVRVRSRRLAAWRRSTLERLESPLMEEDPGGRIEFALAALEPMLPRIDATRTEVIANFSGRFSSKELDEELGQKSLVTIAGGGGGAAYVYLGAWEVLQEAGLLPSYIVGSSMGAILGLFRAEHREADFDTQIRLAKKIRSQDIFRFVSLRRRYGLPGMMRLFLHEGIGSAFVGESGEEMRLHELEVPYDAVVAGIRRGTLDGTPEEYARTHHLHEDERPGAFELRAQLALQLTRLVDFINPKVTREIVLGGDPLTRELNAVDAAGFSGAIPGVLHYDVTRDDPRTHEVLETLMQQEDVVALVDGGVANNVPARPAWRSVRSGRIGTRNCCYLAFDCFHPQWRRGHVLLQPVTRAVALQVASNEPYAHHRIPFSPTLSPLNLIPGHRDLDRAISWGRRQMTQELARVAKLCERVRWIPVKGERRDSSEPALA